MIGDVDRFARDNPAALLAESAIAGFAAARVMKAGAQQSDVSLDDIDPASGLSTQPSDTGSSPTHSRFTASTGTASERTTSGVISPTGTTRTPGTFTGGS
ncbi:MAG: hypothetical protein WA948_10460 [Pontixanthobacter sp.]